MSTLQDIEGLITERIKNLETYIINEQTRSAANIKLAQTKIADLTKLKGSVTERDIALYNVLKEEGILHQLTRIN